MLLFCPHCNTNQDLKIKKDTDEVICSECGNIVQVNDFTRKALRNNRDYYIEQSQLSSFFCNVCQKKVIGKYDKKKNKLMCEICNNELKVTAHMLAAMKMIEKDKKIV